jgi:hypothetical protein
MTKVSVTFAILADDARAVILIIHSSDRIPLSSPIARLWEAKVDLVVHRFPHSITYNYIKDGTQLFPAPRTFTIYSNPQGRPLRVPYPGKTVPPAGVLISFAIPLQSKAQDSPMLLLHGTSHASTYNLVAKDNLWVAEVHLPWGFPVPLCYKYGFAPRNRQGGTIMEPGRPHTLWLNAEIDGLIVSVYDTWAGAVDGLPYICRPLYPAALPGPLPILKVEFLPPEPQSAIFISGNCRNLGGGKLSAAPALLLAGGAWISQNMIMLNEIPFEFKLHGTPEGGRGDSVFPGYRIDAPAAGRPQQWAVRMITGRMPREFGVFVPLVSLWGDGSAEVGDFGTLVTFARWAKRCGIAHIHVHIETLENHTIDPVQAYITYEHPGYDLAKVRDAKLAALWQLFEEVEPRDPELERFLTENPWVAQVCDTPFARWVQFHLFSQFKLAFQRILDIGIQLITDFTLDDELSFTGIFPVLHTMGTLCHGIRLLGLEYWLQPPTEDLLRLLFGQYANVVIPQFFRSSGSGVEQIIRAPGAIEAGLGWASSASLHRSLLRKLQWFASYDPRQNGEFFSSLIGSLPAALIADTRATQFLGARVVHEHLHMIPTSSIVADRVPVVPGYLSPELLSAWTNGETHVSMHASLLKQVESPADWVTVYLHDVELMVGRTRVNEAAPLPLQMIRGHCRFLYPAAVQEMLEDADWIDSIQGMLKWCKRTV